MNNRTILLLAVTAFTILTITCLAPKSRADSKTDNLQAQIAELRAGMQKQALKIMQLEADAKRGREMPIKLGSRKALTGSGLVLEVANFSAKTMPIQVTLISPTFGKTNVFDLVLDEAKITPAIKEIGRREGWAAAPGDLVQVESKGYDTISKHF